MKIRITTRNRYIVEEVDSIEEALSVLEQEIQVVSESLVKLEHVLILSTDVMEQIYPQEGLAVG